MWLRRNWIALAVILVGAAFAAIGIARGEMATVLAKATRICMECVGLG